MPVHDWTRVKAGVFHHFHHSWIEEIQRALNGGLLPRDFYAMAEQRTGMFGPDVLALELAKDHGDLPVSKTGGEAAESGLLLADPKSRVVVQGDLAFYRRKQNRIVIRHVSGDVVVAMIEIVSPGNKASRSATRDFAEKAAALIGQGVHLSVLDILPPTKACPESIHAAIWTELQGEDSSPLDRPLTLVSYESTEVPRAFIEPLDVGEPMPAVPVYLRPGAHLLLPAEETYSAAYAVLPSRWREILDL